MQKEDIVQLQKEDIFSSQKIFKKVTLYGKKILDFFQTVNCSLHENKCFLCNIFFWTVVSISIIHYSEHTYENVSITNYEMV